MNHLKQRSPNGRFPTIRRRLRAWRGTVLLAAGLANLAAPLLFGDESRDAETRVNTSNRGLSDIEVTVDDDREGVPEGRVIFHTEKRPSEAANNVAWIFRASEIINTPVMSETGQELGHIDELVIDVRNGDVRYAAVGLPTFFGPEKLLAIPWGSLTLHGSGEGRLHFVINVPIEKLQKAPGFKRDHWPNVGNRKWADEIAVYYGVIIKEGDLKSNFGTDVKSLDQVPYLMRTQDVVEMQVNDADGEAVGHVRDILVDFATGSARYAICSLKEKSKRNKLLAIPLSVFKFSDDPQSSHYILAVDRQRLANAPSIDSTAWPDIREPRWSQGIDAYFPANQNIQ